MWRLLRTNRDIRWLFVSQVVSFMGDWFAYVAFVGVVHDLRDASILVTLVLVSQSLPSFLVTPIAGPTADRYNRQVVIGTVSIVQAVAALALLSVDSVGSLWVGYVCLCVISALGAFVGPASQAALPNLSRSADELQAANVLFGSVWGAMVAVGAAVGGLVASWFGRDVAFLANAASFVLAAGAVAMIRTPMQPARDDRTTRQAMRPIADMREAIGYARRDSALLAMMTSKATFGLGSGMVGLLAVMVTDEFGGGDTKTGLLVAARGFGVAVGPVIAARFVGASLSRVIAVSGWSMAVFGLLYLGLSITPWFWVGFTLVLLAHLGGGAQWTLSTYGLQLRSPEHVRGRILAGDFGLVTLIVTLSSLAAGALADPLGPRLTVAIFAFTCLAAAAAYLVVTRPVRLRVAREANETGVSEAGSG